VSAETARAEGRIPDFASIEEEAEFWDTHVITDYLDESWSVELLVAPDFKPVLRIDVSLDLAHWEDLARRAKVQGIEPADLAARWLTERLRAEPSRT
jgi:hypothetical protein